MRKKYLLLLAVVICAIICVAFVGGRFKFTYNGTQMNVNEIPLAANGTKINQSTVPLTEEAKTVMIPSEYLERLGFTEARNTGSGIDSVHIFVKDEITLTFVEDEMEVDLNGVKEELAVPPKIIEGELYVQADILWLLGYDYEIDAGGHNVAIVDRASDKFKDKTIQLADALVAGDFATLSSAGTESYKEVKTPEEIKGDFAFASEYCGDYIAFYDYEETYEVNDDGIVVCEGTIRLTYTNGSLLLRFYYEHGGFVDRHIMIPGDFLMPLELREEEVTVGEGTDHPLGGTITLPVGEGPFKVALLLPGSGVVNRDEDVYYTMMPLRDVAWGLAENGVASLRFDKRIYAYEDEYKLDPDLTISEELIEDALLATELLRADGRFDGFYIIGHSLGGMFAPIVNAEGGNFDGIISMAGTARNLWELGKTQKLYYAEHGYADQPEVAATYMSDYDAALSLGNISLIDDALAKTILMGDKYLYYYKDSLNYDLAAAVGTANVPFLVLQGTADFQVYEAIDYALYKELLKDNPKAEFKLYENLNHFFMVSPETGKGTVDEYQADRTKMPDYVTDDMAKFILEDVESE